MTELQERFLRKAADRLPLDRVVEVHLFPPIRQGGQETGIAVVATDPALPVPDPLACDPTDDAAGPPPDAGSPATPGSVAAEAPGDATAASDGHVLDDEAEAVEADAEVPDPEALAEGEALAEEIAAARGRPAPRRHTVYTARYRATLKGPDRGRFEVDVHEEADAPLVTIDAVVRGVQHRAGEPTEPERLTGDQLRALASPVAIP